VEDWLQHSCSWHWIETSGHVHALVSLFRENRPLYIRVEVFTAVNMKNGVFWDVLPCDSCKNRRFGGT
jgi:hypothetical protein